MWTVHNSNLLFTIFPLIFLEFISVKIIFSEFKHSFKEFFIYF